MVEQVVDYLANRSPQVGLEATTAAEVVFRPKPDMGVTGIAIGAVVFNSLPVSSFNLHELDVAVEL